MLACLSRLGLLWAHLDIHFGQHTKAAAGKRLHLLCPLCLLRPLCLLLADAPPWLLAGCRALQVFAMHPPAPCCSR